ncbi:protein-disulfide reductase DsbD family protein [Desulfonatronovibrio magnus]|uniref:protein-disulfide reductase DsbD family protein n=1 Tax=Desulfonatronovibrio magnus TaxID=698827 RepID=UPI0005EBD9FA|nr:cytochrome c biogenesis protein CcdA [Desulfonatronovibrio magnus]
MNTKLRILLTLVAGIVVFLIAGSGNARTGPPADTSLQAYYLPEDKYPEYQGLLVFKIHPEPGIYTYSFDPGPTGYPTRLSIDGHLADELNIYYPPGVIQPDPFEPDQMASVYVGDVPVFIAIPNDIDLSQTVSGRASFLLCSDRNCWPVNQQFEYDLRKLTRQDLNNINNTEWWPSWTSAVPQGTDVYWTAIMNQDSTDQEVREYNFQVRSFTPGLEVRSIFKAALLAILAGLILNFMPCVLPVISLKLRGMIPDNHGSNILQHKNAFRKHNLFFALGMLLFFSILAIVISITGMAWGQIFQSPIAIVILSAAVFGLSLSLFDLYDLPMIDLKSKTQTRNKNPNLEALSTGMLATLLATPCSGPFLGGVLAWALTQSPATIAIVLLCVGLGMAAPYIVLSFFPFMVRFLPRPGNWTLYLEKGLGFLLLATCIYLITLLPESLIMETLILFWIIGVGAWIWGKWTNYSQSTLKRIGIRGVAVTLVLLGAFVLFKPRAYYPAVWISFSQDRFEQVLGQKNFLVEFTADWCPNCKFLEKTVLTPAHLERIGEEFDMLFLRVDLTYQNPAGENLLKSLDSMSIPLVALFSKDNPESPLILRDLFTRNQLAKALDQEFK